MSFDNLTRLINAPAASSAYPDLGATESPSPTRVQFSPILSQEETVWTAPEETHVNLGPSAPMASRASSPERESLCGKCCTPIDRCGRAYAELACGHQMHVACFLAVFGKLASPGVPVIDDRRIGGAANCAQCVKQLHDEGGSFDSQIDERRILKALITKYEQDNRRQFLDATKLREMEASEDLIDRVLNRASTTGLFRRHTDYDSWREYGEPRLCAELSKRDRTFTSIFDNNKGKELTLQDLFVFGVRSYDALVSIGFMPAVHLTKGWRNTCPLWMVRELYNVTDSQLLERCPAAALLETGCRPEELWLVNINVDKLIDNGLSMQALVAYPAKPSMLVKYLGLRAADLRRLGASRLHFSNCRRWSAETNNRLVAPLYKGLV